MNPVSVAVIADDLTGAADSAAGLARTGLVTLVVWDPAAELPSCDALAFSTESREETADEAVRRVAQTAAKVATLTPNRVYKKIDSTLRGHPGIELRAVMEGLGLSRALVCPAFPAQGRTVADDRVLLHGKPLSETEFAGTISSDWLADVFGDGPGTVRHAPLRIVRESGETLAAWLAEQGDGLAIADAETDEDIERLARACEHAGYTLLCGSAGLMNAWTTVCPLPSCANSPQCAPPPTGPTLIIAGSRHLVTRRQVDAAANQGIPVVPLNPAKLPTKPGEPFDELAQIAAEFRRDQSVIVTTPPDEPIGLSQCDIAARLGVAAAAIIEQAPVGRLVLTGGAVAVAVCGALETSALWIQGELAPGTPLSRLLSGPHDGMPVVTKAGGFGGDELLLELLDKP